MSGSVYKVLFVCMGNICRSPAAEGVFRRYVKKRGWQDRIQVASAGTLGAHIGDPPDSRMMAAASRRGCYLESRARKVRREDLEDYDLIVAMDHANESDLKQLFTGKPWEGKLIRFCSLLSGEGKYPDEVPDPYYGGAKGFEFVLDLLEAGCEPLLNFIQSKVSGDGERGMD
ncbi:MAG: low molecular weight protein-tyrosine-phosphatase [Candidatus Methylacidiphilales bacterium]